LLSAWAALTLNWHVNRKENGKRYRTCSFLDGIFLWLSRMGGCVQSVTVQLIVDWKAQNISSHLTGLSFPTSPPPLCFHWLSLFEWFHRTLFCCC
jgi:hypothetical protein